MRGNVGNGADGHDRRSHKFRDCSAVMIAVRDKTHRSWLVILPNLQPDRWNFYLLDKYMIEALEAVEVGSTQASRRTLARRRRANKFRGGTCVDEPMSVEGLVSSLPLRGIPSSPYYVILVLDKQKKAVIRCSDNATTFFWHCCPYLT